MPSEQSTAPIIRRVGDIIQGLAVIAIAGLVVVVIDLRITIVKNQEMINSQERINSQNFKFLRENIELQIKILESVVQKSLSSELNSVNGSNMQEKLNIMSQKIYINEEEIKNIHKILNACQYAKNR